MSEDRRAIARRRRRFLAAALAMSAPGCTPATPPDTTPASTAEPTPPPVPVPCLAPPPPPVQPTTEPTAQPLPCLSVIPDQEVKITAAIYFEPGSSSLSAASGAILDDVARVLKDNPELRVVVVGHCDTTEGVCASATRAEAVKGALVERGVAADRLSTRDVMAGEMIVEDLGGGDRSKNRRVTFEVVR